MGPTTGGIDLTYHLTVLNGDNNKGRSGCHLETQALSGPSPPPVSHDTPRLVDPCRWDKRDDPEAVISLLVRRLVVLGMKESVSTYTGTEREGRHTALPMYECSQPSRQWDSQRIFLTVIFPERSHLQPLDRALGHHEGASFRLQMLRVLVCDACALQDAGLCPRMRCRPLILPHPGSSRTIFRSGRQSKLQSPTVTRKRNSRKNLRITRGDHQ